MTFQNLILNLKKFWANQGCIIREGYDIEKGAGTYNPDTFLRTIGPEPWNSCFVEPCRRPTDGRYGDNPNRMSYFHQFQVLMKPAPDNIQELFLDSLRFLGLDTKKHDIRFVHDDWKSPTLGAWGLGWEVWLDGMEICQFTYFQQVGGLALSSVPVEIAYGAERFCMYLQNIDNVYDLMYDENITYGDLYHWNEVEYSTYYFEKANTKTYFDLFDTYEKSCIETLESHLVLPAYDLAMKCSHCFNILDARKAISVTEREAYILRIRKLSFEIAKSFYNEREKLGFPLLKKNNRKSI